MNDLYVCIPSVWPQPATIVPMGPRTDAATSTPDCQI
jgi:hypothetical protein